MKPAPLSPNWQRLPLVSFGLLLIGSWLAGQALGPQGLIHRGWIEPVLDLPGQPLLIGALAGLGFVWGALAPHRRSPLTQPGLMAMATLILSVGVGALGVGVHSLLILAVSAVGQLISEMMGAQMTHEAVIHLPMQMRETLQFSWEIGLWLAALILLTTLAGSLFQTLRARAFPHSQAIAITMWGLGIGLCLGLQIWSWSVMSSLLTLTITMSLPFWVYEQADQRYWGQGIGMLVSLPIAILGIGVGWALYLGVESVIPSITFAFAALLVIAPAVIVFELCQQQGLSRETALLLSTMALMIPAAGLGLGLLYQGQGLNWLDRVF